MATNDGANNTNSASLANETNIPKPIDPGEKPSDFVKPMPNLRWVLLSRRRRFNDGETEETRSSDGLLPTVTRRRDFVGRRWAVGGRNFRHRSKLTRTPSPVEDLLGNTNTKGLGA